MKKNFLFLSVLVIAGVMYFLAFWPRYQEAVISEAEYPALFQKMASGEGAAKFWEHAVPGVRYSYCVYRINGREFIFKNQQERDEAGNCIPGSGSSLVRVQVKRTKKIDAPAPRFSDGVQMASTARKVERQPLDMQEISDYFLKE